jgi:hypothetical protein
VEAILLPPDPPDVSDAVRAALDAPEAERGTALRAAAAGAPLCLEAWGRLSEHAYATGDDVASYAFARVGYHRGLDALRAAGWRGSQHVPWSHEPNRGFLRSLYGLMRAAAAIGEGVEARRCREFLLQLDQDDHFDVGGIRPADLNRRMDA